MEASFHVLAFWLLFVLLFVNQSKAKNTNIISLNANKSSIIRDTENSLYTASFARYQNKYLSPGFLIKKQVENAMQCMVDCVADFKCLSVNMGNLPGSDGKFQCELLQKDKFDTQTTSFIDIVTYNHFSIWVSK